MIYLDHAATTPVPREVADAMYAVLTERFGNPSSQYPMGLDMKKQVEAWRKTVADALSCDAGRLFFTSCGTEGDNWAIQAACWQNRHLGRHIVTTAVEHSAILEACKWMEQQGYEVTRVVPDGKGNITAELVLAAVRPDTALVSVMMVNNELGNVYPIADIARGLAAKNPKTLLHTDAVQGFLKVPFTARALGADFITISGHKIGGPKGVGALYTAHGTHIVPRVFGGEQERRLRPGTEAMPLIAGFGAAVRAMAPFADVQAHMTALRAQLLDALGALEIPVNSPADGLPCIVNFSVPGIRSETMLHFLAARGVYVSSGSACARGHKSHVLAAMGLPADRIDSAIRVSFGMQNTADDIDQLIDALRDGLNTLTRRR